MDTDSKTEYCLGFMFSEFLNHVLLIKKIKPNWQAGKLNGIGGKLEEADPGAAFAMSREFKEETGIETKPDDWNLKVILEGNDWIVYVYAMIGNPYNALSRTEEIVFTVPVELLPNEVMPNLRWLIPMCLDKTIVFPVVVKDRTP